MENKKEVQPTANSMTSEPACFYSSCNDAPKWSVTSMTKIKQPDGKPLKLYTCDDHYGTLTNNLRNVGTRYTLEPISVPHMVPPPRTPEEKLEELIRDRSSFFKAFVYSCIAVVCVVIGPPMVIYYGVLVIRDRIFRRETK